ncbi:MAG: carbon-nitrogen hydrolase family protein [Candidatus Bathyarchaeota archaeon]|nr:carbon-nitrogen hydrolase family protein [Candidatus Bathyarchaeota archaeon]
MLEKVKAAVAQISPVFMDKEATIDKTCKAIEEAGRKKADIIVFSETHIPGYPYWRGANPISRWSQNQVEYMKNAVKVPSEDTEVLGDAAMSAGVVSVIGCTEMSDIKGSNTLYNSILFYGKEGDLLGKHRKLMPTHGERTVWAQGDARDLKVFDTAIGTVGGLICYEHHMTLLKAAMAYLGEEIHCALWDGYWVMDWHPGKKRRFREGDDPYLCDIDYAVREYAIETQNFVLSSCQYIADDEMPEDCQDFNIASGGSSVVNPAGVYLVEPVFNKETILYADLDLDDRRHTKAYLDALGHYARWDVLRLDMRGEPNAPFTEVAEIPYSKVKAVAEKHGVDPDKLEKMLRELT